MLYPPFKIAVSRDCHSLYSWWPGVKIY